ncbi:MAG: hypothetical protein ACLTXL_14220 [Clostridia bacterium]
MNIKERAYFEARYSGCLSGAESEKHLIDENPCLLTVAYALSPIDLIGFVPVFGIWMTIILPALVFLTCKLIPRRSLPLIRNKLGNVAERQAEKMVLCGSYCADLGIDSLLDHHEPGIKELYAVGDYSITSRLDETYIAEAFSVTGEHPWDDIRHQAFQHTGNKSGCFDHGYPKRILRSRRWYDQRCESEM